MVKKLELVGLGLVAIMSLGFVGAFTGFGIKNGTSELFWGCAGAALMIIVYRKMKQKKEEKENWENFYKLLWNDQQKINRQIYKGQFQVSNEDNMTEQTKQWWEGLGAELQTDIEALDE